MSLTVRTPCTRLDLAEMAGAVSPIQWLVAREMWAKGDTYTILWDGEPIALTGLYPLPQGGHEAWFVFRPAASDHMLAIVRQVRLTLLNGPYSGVVTLCGTEAGKRLARLCGFSFQAASPNGEVWGYEPVRIKFGGRRNQLSSGENPAGATAPGAG